MRVKSGLAAALAAACVCAASAAGPGKHLGHGYPQAMPLAVQPQGAFFTPQFFLQQAPDLLRLFFDLAGRMDRLPDRRDPAITVDADVLRQIDDLAGRVDKSIDKLNGLLDTIPELKDKKIDKGAPAGKEKGNPNIKKGTPGG